MSNAPYEGIGLMVIYVQVEIKMRLHSAHFPRLSRGRRLASGLDKTLLSPSLSETTIHSDSCSAGSSTGSEGRRLHLTTACPSLHKFVFCPPLLVYLTTLDVHTLLATCCSRISAHSSATPAIQALCQDAYRGGEHPVPLPGLDARRQSQGE